MKNKNKEMKLSLAKNIVTANVGDAFLMVKEEEAVFNSSIKAYKYVIVKDIIMAKRGLNRDLTEYDINDKYVVRRNSNSVKPGEVLFDEEQALNLVNELNAKELEKIRQKIDEFKAVESVINQVHSLYDGKASLDYDVPGQVIDLEININTNED